MDLISCKLKKTQNMRTSLKSPYSLDLPLPTFAQYFLEELRNVPLHPPSKLERIDTLRGVQTHTQACI